MQTSNEARGSGISQLEMSPSKEPTPSRHGPEVQDEDDVTNVSSNWMIELVEDCFAKDIQNAMNAMLIPRAREIQANVKVPPTSKLVPQRPFRFRLGIYHSHIHS